LEARVKEKNDYTKRKGRGKTSSRRVPKYNQYFSKKKKNN